MNKGQMTTSKITDIRLCLFAGDECRSSEDPDVMEEYCAENSQACPAYRMFVRGIDLCEYAGKCPKFRDAISFELIDEVCATRTRDSQICYKKFMQQEAPEN